VVDNTDNGSCWRIPSLSSSKMAVTTLHNRSILVLLTIVVLCMLTFIAVHQPQQQYGPTTGSGLVDERLISVRVEDFVDHISEKVLDGMRNEKLLCPTSFHREKEQPGSSALTKDKKVPTIYFITPTYKRPEQIPDLTRLAQTLMHVPSLLWLLIEDAEVLNPKLAEIARRSGIPFVHLIAPMPKEEQKKKVKARGVSNRNRGLEWIRENNADPRGVIYFGDDDNTYDLRVFEEIRSVIKIGMFPVGLLTSTGMSTPIVKDGRVTGFYDGWIANRKFPVDMACFAFSVELLLQKPKATMPFVPGYEEDKFLQSLDIKKEDIEPKAKNCSQILVWHTQTKKNKPPVRAKGNFNDTNVDILYDFLNS